MREVGACAGAGLVGAVGAVAVVVVDAGEGYGDRGMQDTGECVLRFVEFCDCAQR